MNEYKEHFIIGELYKHYPFGYDAWTSMSRHKRKDTAVGIWNYHPHDSLYPEEVCYDDEDIAAIVMYMGIIKSSLGVKSNDKFFNKSLFKFLSGAHVYYVECKQFIDDNDELILLNRDKKQ